MRYRPRRQGVVAYNGLLRIKHHKSAAGTAELVGVSTAHQPVVEFALRAGKPVAPMRWQQWLRCLQAHSYAACQIGLTAISRFNPALGATGASSI